MEWGSFNLLFPWEHIRSAVMVSMLSVWLLVGLFFYLNRYTKREYFNIWAVAWFFYALWLTLNFESPDDEPGEIVFLFKQWCVAISAVFLLWGSLQFLKLQARQTLFGLFMLFLIVWTCASPHALLHNRMAVQLPLFFLIGLSSIFAGICFFRLRLSMPFVGAGMLSLGFQLWGLYLASYPLLQKYKDISSAGFFIGAVLQLFIAVSMIVLVLEEIRFDAEQRRIEIETVRSEKEALQVKIISSEEKCQDLYNQVRLSDGLQKAYDELRRTHQVVAHQERLAALGRMASGAAHELYNALTPIRGYSQLLLSTTPDLPENARNYLQIINKSSNSIAHIVSRMREFSRHRDGFEQLVQVNLNKVVVEVIDLTRSRWCDISQREGININLQPDLEPDLPPLLSDPSELQEALNNLVFNAVDALPRGGTISIMTRSVHPPPAEGIKHGGHWLQIEVRDDGIGMDEETRQRCTEPFFSTKSQMGGAGLGLAMVYGMIQRHEGKFEIDSSPGKGTSVRLTFPVRKVASQPAIAPASDKPQLKQNRSLHILCIDDDEPVLTLMKVYLTHLGHQVAVASTSKEGLKLFSAARQNNRPFEAVITDMGMPDFNGNQVAKAIKAESPGMPIIMITGWGSIMREDKKAVPEVDALINKPPDMDQLNHLLCQLTEPASQDS